jgi:hypothetical protein
VADPALDDVERHTCAGELDGVGVAQLMRREATSHTRVGVRADATRPGSRHCRYEPLERDAVGREGAPAAERRGALTPRPGRPACPTQRSSDRMGRSH